MIQSKTKIYILVLTISTFLTATPNSNAVKLEIVESGKIAKTIQHIHPNISYVKALEYGRGILKASKRYGIETNLLVSIAHQESAFKENLPEGKAGELGICQIRKMWVKNPKFVIEFGNVKEKELLKPEKNFLFAAWILKDLRESRREGVIPYWSYYNANKFHNRFKYYTLVNRYLSAIQTNKPVEPLRRVATLWEPFKMLKKEFSPLPTEPKHAPTIGAPMDSNPLQSEDQYWRPVAHETKSTPIQNKGWIPAALRRLQAQRSRPGQTAYDPAIVKAAFDLNIPSLFGSLPVTD